MTQTVYTYIYIYTHMYTCVSIYLSIYIFTSGWVAKIIYELLKSVTTSTQEEHTTFHTQVNEARNSAAQLPGTRHSSVAAPASSTQRFPADTRARTAAPTGRGRQTLTATDSKPTRNAPKGSVERDRHARCPGTVAAARSPARLQAGRRQAERQPGATPHRREAPFRRTRSGPP